MKAVLYDDLVDALAKVYVQGDVSSGQSMVARLCDDHLDRRGTMLGDVRNRVSDLKSDREARLWREVAT